MLASVFGEPALVDSWQDAMRSTNRRMPAKKKRRDVVFFVNTARFGVRGARPCPRDMTGSHASPKRKREETAVRNSKSRENPEAARQKSDGPPSLDGIASFSLAPGAIRVRHLRYGR